jgi:hypothetical protein
MGCEVTDAQNPTTAPEPLEFCDGGCCFEEAPCQRCIAKAAAAQNPTTDPARERAIEAAIIEMSLFTGNLGMKVRKAIDRYEFILKLEREKEHTP